ncbi:MAG: discoidin domain-containing protein [Aureispira sp.]|nr:discoidin domain-containing protein [Aureispira sp.]
MKKFSINFTLSLCFLLVYLTNVLGQVNIGYGKTAIQSTTDGQQKARMALDNDDNTTACTHWEPTPWWQVDLGARYDISNININVN